MIIFVNDNFCKFSQFLSTILMQLHLLEEKLCIYFNTSCTPAFSRKVPSLVNPHAKKIMGKHPLPNKTIRPEVPPFADCDRSVLTLEIKDLYVFTTREI